MSAKLNFMDKSGTHRKLRGCYVFLTHENETRLAFPVNSIQFL